MPRVNQVKPCSVHQMSSESLDYTLPHWTLNSRSSSIILRFSKTPNLKPQNPNPKSFLLPCIFRSQLWFGFILLFPLWFLLVCQLIQFRDCWLLTSKWVSDGMKFRVLTVVKFWLFCFFSYLARCFSSFIVFFLYGVKRVGVWFVTLLVDYAKYLMCGFWGLWLGTWLGSACSFHHLWGLFFWFLV